jgi:predicted outer membrane repeat protein
MYLTGSLQATFLRGTGVSFTGNMALVEGGAIHCAFCFSLFVSDVAFEDNAAAAGGAICMDRATLLSSVEENRFEGNVAACPGALLPGSWSSSPEAPAAESKQYTCGCGGGGALCIRSASALVLSGNTFLNNSGYAGGALTLPTCVSVC